MRWDLIVIILAIYNAIMIPFEFAFTPDYITTVYYEIADYMIDILFFLDVIINFRTTYVNQKTGLEVTNWFKIAVKYIFFGRFLIDILATIPFDLLINLMVSTKSNNFRLFGLLKLIRLLRLGRIITYLKVKSNLKSTFKILQLLFLLLILVHWTACVWFLLV